MKAQIWGFLAESPVHAGSGQSTGFVDLPVSREAATHHPIIPGSSIKGALRDLARQRRPDRGKPPAPASESDKAAVTPAVLDELDRTFGLPERAGDAIVSDARLVLLPVRSMTSIYRWVTCPYVIERLVRDRKRAGCETVGLDTGALHAVTPGKALMEHDAALFLEERLFARGGGLPRGLTELVGALIMHADTRTRLGGQLVVLHDDDFGWFARYGLTVVARNQLDENKTSGNLWYEEALPPDTVLYALLAERGHGGLDTLRALFEESPYLQVGGNETVGQGWLAVTVPDHAADDDTPGGAG